jgi:protein-tyrosine phosphatase
MKPEVYWIRDIEPFRLAVMPRPRGGEWLDDEISGWQQLGIDAVISLLHRYEAEELGILEEESICRSRGIRYRSFPIRDRGTPESAAEFSALSDEIAASVKEGVAVAVHCRAGIGRSGLLAGSVLLRLGVPASDVFAVVSKARGLSVPDTPEQVEWFHFMDARTRSNNSLERDACKATRASG